MHRMERGRHGWREGGREALTGGREREGGEGEGD